MSAQKVLVIDASQGCGPGADGVRHRVLAALDRHDDQIEVWVPDGRRLAHCIGCFHCWIETPGVCRYADGMADLLAAIVRSDTVLWLERLRFGGHSAALKQVLDRTLGLMLSDFVLAKGELSHPPRYPHPPRLVGIAVTERATQLDDALYGAVVGRNARNLHAPSHAAAVVSTVDDPSLQLATIEAALDRCDPLPSLDGIARLVPPPLPATDPTRAGHALLLVGSPRQLSPSTSQRLGERILIGLRHRGWTSETRTVSRALRRELERRALLEAWRGADLVVIASPIYLDTPPYLLTAALEAVSRQTEIAPARDGQRIAALFNSSFPQSAQSSLALAVCARFAHETGIIWAGGLAIGAGAWIEGRPLEGRGRSLLPTGRLLRALDLAAAALAVGAPVPDEAVALSARAPVGALPFWLWQRLYGSLTGRALRARAARHGVGGTALRTRPYCP
jgi:multimeric flavodoxin WrbA